MQLKKLQKKLEKIKKAKKTATAQDIQINLLNEEAKISIEILNYKYGIK